MDQLALFPDIELRPTIAMQRGESTLLFCRHDGTLVCIPTTVSPERTVARLKKAVGPCPTCGGRVWTRVDLGTGPFKKGKVNQ